MFDSMVLLSIIIPTLNEAGTVEELVRRIVSCCGQRVDALEIIFIDDHSEDNTVSLLQELAKVYPIRVYLKSGKPGKSFSLLEGFKKARGNVIGMIDADLQYPPEYIPKMLSLIEEGADIVVANRKTKNTTFARQVISSVFRTIFVRGLHKIDVDAQSGLKLFKKKVLDNMRLDPTPWTFDLEFLIQARARGYSIASADVPFLERTYGSTKVDTVKTSFEIGKNALHLKFKDNEPIPIEKSETENHTGFHYKGKNYHSFSRIPHFESALMSLNSRQKLTGVLLVSILTFIFIASWHTAIVILMSILTLLYFADLIYNFFLLSKTFTKSSEIVVADHVVEKIHEELLPMYTIFCPLYKEANVLSQFTDAMNKLDYPTSKLQIMILLEEDDKETQDAAYSLNLPIHYEIVIVPNTNPRTKPKACNYGLTRAKGEFCVIYDAEDIPESKQLLRVVYAFGQSNPNIGCIQAKLNFYNPNQNLLTRLFTAEYTLWFDLILPGLQSLDSPIPLGGTSNHFRTSLLKYLGGWDAFNVTEDCDLGMRLTKNGYSTMIIDSTTMEEANSMVKNWFNQRTRWIKGYLQTYFVHSRNIGEFLRKGNLFHIISFMLTVGGKSLFLFVNPFLWIISFSYFIFRQYIGEFIESLYLTPIFYMGIFAMIFGNFIYLYSYMIAVAKKKRFDLIKYTYFVPFYWLAMSLAAWVSLYRLITKPHHWSKTMHGLHLQSKSAHIRPQNKIEHIRPQLAFDYQKVV